MKSKASLLVFPLLLRLASAEPFLIDPADFDPGEAITSDFATLSVQYVGPPELLPDFDFELDVVASAGFDLPVPSIAPRITSLDTDEQNIFPFWPSLLVFRIDFDQDMFSTDVFISGEGGMRVFNRDGGEIAAVGVFGVPPPMPAPQDFFGEPDNNPAVPPPSLSFFSPAGNIAAVEISFRESDTGEAETGDGEIFGVAASAIPEPSTMGLLLVSLAAFMKFRRLGNS